MSRKHALKSLMAIGISWALLLCAGRAVSAQTAPQAWPTKPIKIIVPWPPGGAADIACRHLQQPLGEILGQQVIVENKSGAGGVVGTEALVRSPADGHTIGMVISSHASNPALYATLPYDAVKDLKPITILVRSPNMLGVHPSTPYKSVADIVAAAKAQPGKLHYATSGNGTAQHLGAEHLKLALGLDITHVPYKGAGPALNDLVNGQVQIGILNMAGMLPHVQAGRLRGLAVSGPKRSPAAPDVPSLADTVPGFDFVEWFALMAPAGVSDEIVERLYGAIVKAARSPAFAPKVTNAGMELDLLTPADFRVLIAAEIKKFASLIERAKIRID